MIFSKKCGLSGFEDNLGDYRIQIVNKSLYGFKIKKDDKDKIFRIPDITVATAIFEEVTPDGSYTKAIWRIDGHYVRDLNKDGLVQQELCLNLNIKDSFDHDITCFKTAIYGSSADLVTLTDANSDYTFVNDFEKTGTKLKFMRVKEADSEYKMRYFEVTLPLASSFDTSLPANYLYFERNRIRDKDDKINWIGFSTENVNILWYKGQKNVIFFNHAGCYLNGIGNGACVGCSGPASSQCHQCITGDSKISPTNSALYTDATFGTCSSCLAGADPDCIACDQTGCTACDQTTTPLILNNDGAGTITCDSACTMAGGFLILPANTCGNACPVSGYYPESYSGPISGVNFVCQPCTVTFCTECTGAGQCSECSGTKVFVGGFCED